MESKATFCKWYTFISTLFLLLFKRLVVLDNKTFV